MPPAVHPVDRATVDSLGEIELPLPVAEGLKRHFLGGGGVMSVSHATTLHQHPVHQTESRRRVRRLGSLVLVRGAQAASASSWTDASSAALRRIPKPMLRASSERAAA